MFFICKAGSNRKSHSHLICTESLWLRRATSQAPARARGFQEGRGGTSALVRAKEGRERGWRILYQRAVDAGKALHKVSQLREDYPETLRKLLPKIAPPPLNFSARAMADHAFEWARPRGLVRKSVIHGAEEADIPYEFDWTKIKESGNRVSFESSFSMDVPQLHELDCFIALLPIIASSCFAWNLGP